MLYLIVFAGAGIGGALRHGVNEAALRLGGAGLPAATLLVNVAGSLAMGVLAGYFASRTGLSQHVRLFLTTGILGGFTTFSAFSLDTALLIERQAYWSAAGYAAASVLCSVGALFVGLSLYRAIGQLP
ncbi:MAG: fluoride efflux transporter CrcB [Pseudomonadota bacterium]|nr:fluoride efflux transporter CrcB [Sphingomonas sp.]MDQ3471913.1 fluoride efflux transporter CrcB [Pseudomonadota bacterium]